MRTKSLTRCDRMNYPHGVWKHRLNAILLGALALVVIGCAPQKPAPLKPPVEKIVSTHYLGTSISGPQSGVLAADAGEGALVVKVRLGVATQLPPSDLAPAGADARLVVATRDRQPVLPTGNLTAPLRWGVSKAADGFNDALRSAADTEVGSWPEILLVIPKGVTAQLRATGEPLGSGDEDRPEVQMFISNTPDRAGAPMCETAISLTDLITPQVSEPPKGVDDPADPKPGERRLRKPIVLPPPSWQREMIVFRPQAVDVPASMALSVPFAFKSKATDRRSSFVVATVQASALSGQLDSDQTAALARCSEDVTRESGVIEARMKQRLRDSNWPGFNAARDAAADTKTRRAALVYLAGQTGALLARDVFLTADDATLAKLLEQITTSMNAISQAGGTDAALSLNLDIVCLRFAAKEMSENKLPDELRSVLTSYAGEAGRHAASIEEIVKKLNDRGELQTRLIAENMIYLEDSSPAARVRAYDWLRARDRAPAGFDPLGDPRARRDALEKAIAPPAAVAPGVVNPAPATP